MVIFDIMFFDFRAFDLPSAYTTSLAAAVVVVSWLLPALLLPFDIVLLPLALVAALLLMMLLLKRDRLTPDSRVAADPRMMEMRRLLLLPLMRWSGRLTTLPPAWDPAAVAAPERTAGGGDINTASSGLLGRN